MIKTRYFKHGLPPDFKFKYKNATANNVSIDSYSDDQEVVSEKEQTKMNINLVICQLLVVLLRKSEKSGKENSKVNHVTTSAINHDVTQTQPFTGNPASRLSNSIK